MKRLGGKVAIVTASISGIGLACVKRFAEEGATVYLAAHLKEEAEREIMALKAEHLEAKFVYFNALEDETHRIMIEEVIQNEGKVDILVNNYGGTHVKYDLDVVNGDTEAFFNILNTNIKSVYLTSKTVIPYMKKQKGGSIINISSIGSVVPDFSRTAYGVSKAAINALTQDIAIQYARDGIRCNAVLPGLTATPAALGNMSDEFRSSFLAHVPMGRMATPEDIANAVLYYASDEGAFATGMLHLMSGGFGLATPQYVDFAKHQVLN